LSVPKIVIHTDVFLDHLAGSRRPSVLRESMGKFFCYATVFQAIELFSFARLESEYRAIEDSMAALKLLGLNPKNARKYGELIASCRNVTRWNILTAGLCLESRLPLLTDRRQDFKGVPGLLLVPSRLVRQFDSGAEIIRAAQKKRRSYTTKR